MIPFDNNILISSYFEAQSSGSVVSLLPFGHSRHYPLSFDLGDRRVISGNTNFFNTPFYKNFDANRFIDPEKCEVAGSQVNSSLIVMNLLDNCFGHSLLKLFYAISFIEKEKSNHDFLLILPAALRHFAIPGTGLLYLFVNCGFGDLQNCYSLNNEIKKISDAYGSTWLEGVETYSAYDLKQLRNRLKLTQEAGAPASRNNIIFYYRSDYFRMWDGLRQRKHIVALFTFLRPFFSDKTRFIVIGDRDDKTFPSWIGDERISRFSEDADFKYNDLFDSAMACFGLTGSHMIFPSLLSACSVHLHPVFKHKNMAEDIVAVENANEMFSAYKHLYYHGNYNCSDLKPVALGRLFLVHFAGLVEKEYKTGRFASSQEEWITASYPDLNYRSVLDLRTELNTLANRKMAIRARLDKLMKHFI